MKLYRILTENKNYNAIQLALDAQFPSGYTIINANGAWHGEHEKSLVIEIVSTLSPNKQIEKFCYWLKKNNDQQAVMVQTLDTESKII
jgi:uncharacterized membrane-anchored protein YitT (DUF2179 family)